jgi:hypothetical protein
MQHDRFKLFSWNRNIDERHVRHLMREIAECNLIDFRPIIVTDKFFILDGQHRHEALKRLNLRVSYVVMAGLTEEEEIDTVIKLNSCAKDWRPKDYTTMHETFDNTNYIKLGEFAKKHTIPFESAKKLCSTKHCKLQEFKDGMYQYDNEAHAELVMELANALLPRFREAKLNRCLMGLNTLVRIEGFHKDHFLRRVNANVHRLHSCANPDDYINMFIDELYNRHTTADFAISYNKKKVKAASTIAIIDTSLDQIPEPAGAMA